MGDRALAVIHAEPSIAWHSRARDFAEGLKSLGVSAEITNSRQRVSDAPAILLGTTLWRQIESEPGDWLLVDRASYCDPDYVQLGWNGHGRRGDHCVPVWADGDRWESNPVPMRPSRHDGEYRVICGQTESYCEKDLERWYLSVYATHFRPHPQGSNPTMLPIKKDFDDAVAVVLNSSIGVQCVFDGVPTEVHDEGAMSYGIWELWGNDRKAWASWLAWTQWRWDEIRDGKAIAHLFDQRLA